jgi:hypothetical protein
MSTKRSASYTPKYATRLTQVSLILYRAMSFISSTKLEIDRVMPNDLESSRGSVWVPDIQHEAHDAPFHVWIDGSSSRIRKVSPRPVDGV